MRRRAKILRMMSRIKGMGSIFPRIAAVRARGMGKPAATPRGRAARSSRTGSIAVKKVEAKAERRLLESIAVESPIERSKKCVKKQVWILYHKVKEKAMIKVIKRGKK